jgi:hypothetical protein
MLPLNHLPPPLGAALQQQLRAGETLLWAAQPQAVLFARSGFMLAAFGALGALVGLYMLSPVLGSDGLPPFPWALIPLAGLVPVAVSLALVAHPLRLRRAAQCMLYALTDQRALFISNGPRPSTRSMTPAEITSLECTAGADGAGNLILRRQLVRYRNGRTGYQMDGFLAVADVERVHTLLKQVLRQHGHGNGAAFPSPRAL